MKENSSFDDKIWCIDCSCEHETKCPVHGDYVHVRDKQIPTRARLTAPHHVHIRQLELTLEHSHVYGVFAKKCIAKRMLFGPVEGSLTDTWKHSREDRLKLKIFKADGTSKYLDCTDENNCNWMMFVRPSETPDSHNMLAYQNRGCIYFCTSRVIQHNEELRVWYAKNYEDMLKKYDDTLNRSLELAEGNVSDTGLDSENEVIDDMTGRVTRSRRSVHSATGSTPVRRKPGRPKKQKNADKIQENEEAASRSQEIVPQEPMEITTETTNQNADSDEDNTELPDLGGGDYSPQSPLANGTTNQILENIEHVSETVIEIIPSTNSESPTNTRKSKRGKLPQNEKHVGVSFENPDNEIGTMVNKQIMVSPKRETIVKSGRRAKAAPEGKETAKKNGVACEVCGEEFASQRACKTHQRHKHKDFHQMKNENGLFVCEEAGCDKTFPTEVKLKRHVLIHGGTDRKTFKCRYCDKVFHRKDHLQSHMRTHNPVKDEHKCEHCGKIYHSPYPLRCHIAGHMIDKGDLTCYVCKETFASKEEIEFHLKKHLGSRLVKTESQKKHACRHCDMRFFTRKDMQRHEVTHTKARPFMCHLCPQAFGRQDHLTRHINSSHDVTKQEKVENSVFGNASLATGQQGVVAMNTKPGRKRKAATDKKRSVKAKKGRKTTKKTENLPVNNITNIQTTAEEETRYVLSNGQILISKLPLVSEAMIPDFETLQANGANYTVLQKMPTQQPPTLTNQKTVQVGSLLASNTDLNLLQNFSLPDLGPIEGSLLKYLQNTGDNDILKSSLLNINSSAKSQIIVAEGGKQITPKIAIPRITTNNQNTGGGKGKEKNTGKRKSPKSRRSSSRSSLTSQPTLPVELLPGTSHLASPPPQHKPEVQHSPPQMNQFVGDVSMIDKMNLTEMFGEQAKQMEKNLFEKLMKELHSVTAKLGLPSSATQSEDLTTEPIVTSQSNPAMNLNVPSNVQGNSNTQQPGQVVQVPKLNAIDTQTLINQILAGNADYTVINPQSNPGNDMTNVSNNPVSLPKGVQLVHVLDQGLANQPGTSQNTNIQGLPQIGQQTLQQALNIGQQASFTTQLLNTLNVTGDNVSTDVNGMPVTSQTAGLQMPNTVVHGQRSNIVNSGGTTQVIHIPDDLKAAFENLVQ